MESVDIYLLAGETEKALKLGNAFIEETLSSINMFAIPYRSMYLSKSDIENNLSYLFYIADIYRNRGLEEEADALEKRVESIISAI